jgi:hypothetical protein
MRTAYRSSHLFNIFILPGTMAVRWEPPANTYVEQVKGSLKNINDLRYFFTEMKSSFYGATVN